MFWRLCFGDSADKEMQHFQQLYRIPRIVGIIDGTYIQIQAHTENEELH